MRRAGVIIGVLILSAAFAAAWFTLGPSATGRLTPDVGEDMTAGQHCASPLEAPNGQTLAPAGNDSGAQKPSASPGSTAGSETAGTTPPPDGTTAGEAPAPQPGETTAGKAPAPQPAPTATGEAPVPPDAGEAPAPQPFIKGHDRPPGQNLGNTRPGARVIAKPTGVKALDEVSAKLMQDRRGLYAEYFALGDGGLADLDTANPDMVRIDREVYFPDAEAFSDLPISLNDFAAVWTGFLLIPEHGDYWLFWGADNGGRVELDGETVLLQDGMVRYVEVSAVLTLAPGLHPLRIEFAQEHNNVADWAKCAANFMWVPQGQSKPVPVPPEMLMVPEWMWSDNAPIITSLSKYEGEIGDEITIHGQGLRGNTVLASKSGGTSTSDIITADRVRVTFGGQEASVLEASKEELRVRVPIGAKTGTVIIYRTAVAGIDESGKIFGRPVPSNSVDFTVTTQFGLLAEWHNLEGWDNFGFEALDALSGASPQVSGLESNLTSLSQPQSIDAEFVLVLTGRVGIPIRDKSDRTITGDESRTFQLHATHPFRVTIDSTTDVAPEAESWARPEHPNYYTTVSCEAASDSYVNFRLELLGNASEKPLAMEVTFTCNSKGGRGREGVTGNFLAPPAIPPSPPVISKVKGVLAEAEQPSLPPYDAEASRPSVRVGQEFTFELYDEGPEEMWAQEAPPMEVSIDGVRLVYTRDSVSNGVDGFTGRTQKCRATMPEGVGEGRMVARLSVVTSEPVFIDVANRGLVAYLYDVPDASALAKLPDLGPLHCFKVRKDRAINFESAASFDLPFPAETFVIEWLGGLIIEEEGDYTFTCRSDDGMKLWLDDNVVLDADKLQAPAENSATVHLVPGTYRFRMQFFENNQHEVCVLEWAASRDGQSVIPREVIPARAFTLDTHPPFPNKTSTGKRTDGS